jgi:predicted AAA+ superfamily ATPase
MYRLVANKLKDWKSSVNRKPLILRGARQVGKTWLLKEFGLSEFPAVHYVNFEEDERFGRLFETDLHPARILDELRFHFGRAIDPVSDLLFFDEIQRCPRALTALKYFNEEMPEVAVCAAGSLLGVCLSPETFPVGKVAFLDLFPMTFEEFLLGIGEPMLAQALLSIELGKPLPEMAHERLWGLWKHYLIVGGMPEAVKVYSARRADSLYDAFTAVRKTQRDLTDAYLSDIAKHSGKINALHIERLWRNVPAQLARMQDAQSPRFRFKDAVPGVSGYERLSGPLDWLESAGLLIRTFIVEFPAMPLSSQVLENRFKLYFHDTGMLGSIGAIAPEAVNNYGFGSYQGYVAENFVAQELTAAGHRPLYAWQGRTSEIEFLLAHGSETIPLEVKSGLSTKAKSLGVYQEKFAPSRALLLSGKNVWQSGVRLGLPLYAAGMLGKILGTR